MIFCIYYRSVSMTDNSTGETLKTITISEKGKTSSEAKTRFEAKQAEIHRRVNEGTVTIENANKEIVFFHNKYNENFAAEKKLNSARQFSPPVGVPLLPRLYYAVKGLINNGFKGAAYGFKEKARTYAAPKDKANIDFQQIQDELAYFQSSKLLNINVKENEAWNKVSDFVKRKASENEKWGINPDKFEKDLAKNLKGFVVKIRKDELIAQALSEQGLVEKSDMEPLSSKNIERNAKISSSVDSLIAYFKQNNSFRKDVAPIQLEGDKNKVNPTLASKIASFMGITKQKESQSLTTDRPLPVLNNFIEKRKESEKNEASPQNKVVTKNINKPNI